MREINSIVNAVEILKRLSEGMERLSDISAKLNINKATVHQILGTLKSRGLAAQDPATRKYFLGPLIQSIAFHSNHVHQILIECAHQELENIRDLSGETIGLHIKYGPQRIIIDQVHSKRQIVLYREIGQSAPLYAGAAGKVLLSEMSRHDLDQILQGLSLVSVGPNTITDKAALRREVEKVKSQGYALSINETYDSATAIAVPVKEYPCPVAIGIIGPERRLEENTAEMLRILRNGSEKISDKLKRVWDNSK